MKTQWTRTALSHWIILLLIFAFTAFLSQKLITSARPFYDWDESIYIQVGKEMVDQGSPTPLWQDEPWLEKPPLAPYIYGLLVRHAPGTPEVTTRLLSLLLSSIALGMVYLWVFKATKNKYLAVLTAVIVACNPTFLQRAQTVNTDVFLLIGWLGYLLTFPRFGPSLLFLFIGVFSKSLLGFYPLAIILAYDAYQVVLDRRHISVLMKNLRIMVPQAAIMLIWFIVMILFYGQTFIQVHFIDHMVRRVTSSIESHFGKRTYYFDEVFIQYGFYSLLAVVGVMSVFLQRLRKKITDEHMLHILFLLPWFLFLNVTKTKISWYLYPAVPQIAYMMAYPLRLIEKYKLLMVASALLLSTAVVYNTHKAGSFRSHYSEYDQTYDMSMFARDNCLRMAVLIDRDGRETYKVLSDMGLTISTSAIYGNHPSIVYYASQPVSYIYDKTSFLKRVNGYPPNTCIAIEEKDTDVAQELIMYRPMKEFGDWSLYRKNR